MNWRLIAVVTSAGTSIGLIALGAYAVAAANTLEPKKLALQKNDAAPSFVSVLNATSIADAPSSNLWPSSVFAATAVRTSSVIVSSDEPRLAEHEGFEPPPSTSESSHEASTLGYVGNPPVREDSAIQLAAAPESQPMLYGGRPAVPGDHSALSKSRYDCARPFWDIAKVKSPGRLNSRQTRYCPTLEPASIERGRPQIATRRLGGERIPAKVALILGIAF